MLELLSSLNLSLSQGSEPTAPFPAYLKLTRVQKEISFRIENLKSWKKLIRSNENTTRNATLVIDIKSLLKCYKALLNLNIFSEQILSEMVKIDKSSLHLVHPTLLNKDYQIIEYPRPQRQGKCIKKFLMQLPSDVQCKIGRHTSVVSDVILSSDSSLMIYSSYDYLIHFWHILSSQTIQVLRGHSNYITSIALAGKEKLLISGSYDGKVFIWNLEKSTKIFELACDSVQVLKVCVSNNDEFLAVSYYSGKIFVYSLMKTLKKYSKTGKFEIFEPLLIKSEKIVKTLVFSSNNKTLFCGSQTQGILVFNLKTKQRMSLHGHSEVVNDMKIYDLDTRLVSVGQDLDIKIWDLVNLKMLHSVKTEFKEYLSSVVVVEDRKKAFVAGRDCFVIEFDLTRFRVLKMIDIQKGFVNRLALRRENELIVCNDNVTCYHLESGAIEFEVSLDEWLEVAGFDYFKSTFIGINHKNRIIAYDLKNFKKELINFSLSGVKTAAFTGSKKYFALSNSDTIQVFQNLDSRKKVV